MRRRDNCTYTLFGLVTPDCEEVMTQRTDVILNKTVSEYGIAAVTINTLYSADAPMPRMFSSLLVL